MGKEIEHKYLVMDDSYIAMSVKKTDIIQGYLSRQKERTVRIRVADEHGYITVKGATKNAERSEYEYEIPYTDAIEMISMCEQPIVRKQRFIVPYKGYIWEIDRFETPNKGLILAEIELEEETNDYPLPPFVGENVTGQSTYFNSNMK